ncbi:VRR-NUC domain-containing protein [Pseudoalteromonas sp. Of7M-16]|uniref:VRR-NUC domain-containing protein n=1 Tax=Pseudoalteromonas sp. Of7M-16 TaxID=2917756 RepID=UPI001EF5D86E|nr:VRR-NUC domain-containing protein [Pseudoalteromonas sp. Of7M-16]MCG7550896.1 VRR-NUC domain-containing protein [Pseudoalteromonas sp. Of7M-16]
MLRFDSEDAFNSFLGQRKPKNRRNVKAKQPNVSPHARALAALAKKPELRKGNIEHYEQVQLFDFFERYHPEIYELLSAYPAGGMRSKKTAFAMQAEGQKKGYPDIILDMAKGTYHGARFELKAKGGRASEAQLERRDILRKQGYYSDIFIGWESLKDAILLYSKLADGAELDLEKK